MLKSEFVDQTLYWVAPKTKLSLQANRLVLSGNIFRKSSKNFGLDRYELKLRGSPYPEVSKNRFFFLFQSMDLLSENIVAKFHSPYRNSFDGRVPSSGFRGASGRFFSPSENFKARFLKTTFFKIACPIKVEPIKLLL